MPQSNKREVSRERIVEATSQAFRKHGFAGIGVDGLAKSAQFTSGAFYFHFASKLEAFIESTRAGLNDLRKGIENVQSTNGSSWLKSFASFYMGFKRTCDLGEGCTLPSLSVEVERAGGEARAAYEEKIVEVANVIARGLKDNPQISSREQSWVILALLSGGVNLARAVQDQALSDEIAGAVQKAVGSFDTTSGAAFARDQAKEPERRK